MADLLSIGQVATATGVAITTLRYYDERGLIEPSCRVGGQRRFEPGIVGRVGFVRQAQEVGFSLDEIRLILAGGSGGELDRPWQEHVGARRAALIEQRDRLDRMIAVLDDIERCGCTAVLDCPMVDDW